MEFNYTITDYKLTTPAYRRLVAHMIYWQRGLQEALVDCDLPVEEAYTIVMALSNYGYEYDFEKDTLTYVL